MAATHWCFTLDHYTEAQRSAILGADADYVVVGRGLSEDGTPVLQGYVRFGARMRFHEVKVLLRPATWVMATGSPQSLRERICVEGGDFEERGSVSATRRATPVDKYEHAWAMAKLGRLHEISPDICVKYYHNLRAIQKDHVNALAPAPQRRAVWIHGPVGSGKGAYARSLHPTFYVKASGNHALWGDYMGEEVVIVENLTVNDHNGRIGSFISQWCDTGRAFVAHQREQSICIAPTCVIVTSTLAPGDIRMSPHTRGAFEVIRMHDDSDARPPVGKQ